MRVTTTVAVDIHLLQTFLRIHDTCTCYLALGSGAATVCFNDL